MAGRDCYPLRTTETISIISKADLQLNTDFLLKLAKLFVEFDLNHENSDYNPAIMLRTLAEMLEEATNIYIKNDPDPLDDRHPFRTHPESALGNILKVIFKNDDFMTKLVVSYILSRDNVELNIQGSRVLLACIPGLDSKVVFSEPDDFIPRLYTWAQDESNETMQGYAMGLLAGALENTENASKYRTENSLLVPYALNRLRTLQQRSSTETAEGAQTDFSQLSTDQNNDAKNGIPIPTIKVTEADGEERDVHEDLLATSSSSQPPPPKKRRTEPCLSNLLRAETAPRVPSYQNLRNLDDSNSKWDILQPFLIGTQQVYPLSLPMYQRYILQYLAACGEYQDLLQQVFEGNALQLLLDYIDLDKSKDIRLTFDALKYLTSLLVHRKFAIEFIEKGGLMALLRLPRTSLASVGVVTCLYYIAYSVDVMEKICQMESSIIDETIEYVLWCLEHSYESGMASACMFFSQALYYKPILRRFDQFDGPRKLYNYIATLTLMQCGSMDEHVELTEEQVHTSTQCVRAVCIAARSYLTAHIFVKCETYKKTYGDVLPTGMTVPELVQIDYPEYKTLKAWEDVAWECELIVLEMMRLTGSVFREAEHLRKLGFVRIFLAVRIISRDWTSISIHMRNETCVHAIDTLSMMLCQPSIQLELLPVNTFHTTSIDGLNILLETTQGRYEEDPALQQSALSCIQKCVCVHPESWKVIEHMVKTGKLEANPSQPVVSLKKLPKKTPTIMFHLEKMWYEVRKIDGISKITNLIFCRTPLTEADAMRKQATNTMAGLARHPEVRQILSKLPLITQTKLQFLMREPVCSDKRDIHAAFCKEAMMLLQIVTGKKMSLHQKDIPVHGLAERHNHDWIMENTKITYNETELLQLIHDHLVKKGLNSVAAMLRTEAKLPDRPASRTNITPVRLRPFPSLGNNFTKLEDTYPTLAPRVLESEIGGISARRPSQATSISSPLASRSMSHEEEVFATPTLPRRFTNNGSGFPKRLAISPARGKQRPSSAGESGGAFQPCNDLNSIVIDHFKNQHAKCKNPVTTVPPFSLYFPHQCPEHTPRKFTVTNMSSRILDHELLRPEQRIISQWSNERTIFSRFRCVKLTHDHEESYTRGAFSVDDEHLIVGLFNGEVHWHNVETGSDDGHTNCHGSAITHIEQSKDGSLLLTSSAYVRPLSALWRLGEAMTRVHVYKEETAVRFANTTMQRIIGTCGSRALVYDTETNIVVDTYEARMGGLRYERNYASFSPDDQLIFNDGLLWDVRQKNRKLHMFDRLNIKTQSGSFHPHRPQIIINSEVYDLRTFKMLHHVPELDQCQVTFNSTGNIMYSWEASPLNREHFPEKIYPSFRSFDTSDYTALTTFEGRRPVLDICSSHQDQKLCVIEQCRPMMADYMVQAATQIRLCDVGRLKEHEDEEEADEEQAEEREHEMVSESETSEEEEEEEADVGMDSPDRGSVFEALGRLGDNSSSSVEDPDEDRDSASDSDVDVFRVIDRMMNARRRRNNANNNRRRPLLHVNIDGNEANAEQQPAPEDPQVAENGAENGGEPNAGPAGEEEDEDPDFDVDAAIDRLVDRVDSELDEDFDSDSDESWRTASHIGSEDINLDDLDEDAAREAESNGENRGGVQQQEQGEGEQQEEGLELIPDMPMHPPPPGRRVRGLNRREFHFQRQLDEFQRQYGRRGAFVPDALNARVEEQRAQFMDALGRHAEAQEEELALAQAARDQEEYQSEDEMEINSVSTVPLNPALRRQNRRRDE